jgi:hypothetical protein
MWMRKGRRGLLILIIGDTEMIAHIIRETKSRLENRKDIILRVETAGQPKKAQIKREKVAKTRDKLRGNLVKTEIK